MTNEPMPGGVPLFIGPCKPFAPASQLCYLDSTVGEARRVVANNPFEGISREFKRAIEEHGRLLDEEMNRVQQEVQSAMAQVRDEMQRVGAELRRAMDEIRRHGATPPHWEEIVIEPEPVDRSLKKEKSSRKKKPRRKPPGTAAAPVKPRPKPKPLVGGAEAPIE